MQTVANFIAKEVKNKQEQKEKLDAIKKRRGTGGQAEQEVDEVAEMQAKLTKLELSEET